MKLRNLLLLGALPVLALITSCDPKEADKPKPTVTFDTNPMYVYQDAIISKDSWIIIKVVGNSNDKKLKNLNVTLSTNGGAAGTIKDTMITSATLNFTYKYKVIGTVGDKQTLTFKLTDDNGESASKAITISLAPVLKSLSQTGAQTVYNIWGTYKGAYDLYTLNQVAKNEPEANKDIKDLTPTSTVFNASWGSGNFSKYAKLTANDWINTTTSTHIYNLWVQKAATALDIISGITVGDVYVIKAGQQGVAFPYYLIKIDKVVNTPSDNNDYIEFSVKTAN